MRRPIVVVAVLTVFAQLGVPVLEACGAKFLVATRSARFQRAQHVTRPASILLYQHDDDAGVVEFMTALQSALNGVGHKVTLVANEAALRNAASSNRFNVVMMQLEEALRLRADLKSWSPGAAILPMAAFLTRPQAARAREEFGQILALPAKTSQVFSVVQAAYR
jgi:DNA-binding NtrC family response regulator